MIEAPATLGLLGGGQLGRYFVLAAHKLGYRVMLLDPDRHSPTGRIADEHLIATYDDRNALDRLANSCAAVTTEFENVPAESLAYLARNVPVRPGPEAVATCQDRATEKSFLKQHGFAHAPYAEIHCDEDILKADISLFPCILKLTRSGYDGKGQTRVRNVGEALMALRCFRYQPCVLEKLLPLDSEISVVLARGEDGQMECYPAIENSHRQGILDTSVTPARAPRALAEQAESIAREIAEKLAYIGTLAVEFFVVGEQIYVNEIAPRPHNSGHFTLDACQTDQFEQQVRALCGLPLGKANVHSASVMVNLLGDLWPASTQPGAGGAPRRQEPDWQKLLTVPNLKLHLYGKDEAKPGRKMGHFTVLGEDAARAIATAMAAREAIGISDEPA